jgi:hypothetical protein
VQRLNRADLDRRAGPAWETGLNDAVIDPDGAKLLGGLVREFTPMIDKDDPLAARNRITDDLARDDGLARAGRRYQTNTAAAGSDLGVDAGDDVALVRPQEDLCLPPGSAI